MNAVETGGNGTKLHGDRDISLHDLGKRVDHLDELLHEALRLLSGIDVKVTAMDADLTRARPWLDRWLSPGPVAAALSRGAKRKHL